MIESDAVKNWLYAKLTGNGTVSAAIGTGVYQSVGPEKAAYPFVVYDFLLADDIPGICDVRVKTEFNLQVKVIYDKAPDSAGRALNAALANLLQHVTNDVSNGYVITARRTRIIDYKEPKPNSAEIFYHIGGEYFVQVSTA